MLIADIINAQHHKINVFYYSFILFWKYCEILGNLIGFLLLKIFWLFGDFIILLPSLMNDIRLYKLNSNAYADSRYYQRTRSI